ncbi:MAG: hypothetical protein ACI9DK_001164 [Vicingaceae bacterium]|jgi:hypothetical protein
MNVQNDIQHKKDLFSLPYVKDQLEYWGPVNRAFADSFLTMGYKFIYQYFGNLDSKFLKSVFSSFVEIVQNVAEYNEGSFKDNSPQSFIRLKDLGGQIVIDTCNSIKPEDKLAVQTVFEKVFDLPKEELQAEYKKLLFKGGSLGLIMLRKLKNSEVEYSLSENDEGELWLSIELKMNYGNT